MDAKHEQQEQRQVSRRQFLQAVGAAAAGATLARWGRSVPAMAAPRVLGANDRIRIGVIGVGNMGSNHLRHLVRYEKEGTENLEVVAVCDVFQKRLDEAVKTTQGKAKGYRDYRRLLERKDIDVVWIATPDHWHAKIAIEALEAGKDIYLEKPMTHTFEEAKNLHRTAKRTGGVVQVGTQLLAEDVWYKAQALIREGRIGKVVWSQGSYCRNSREGEWNYSIDPEARPGENLDWDMWLGWRWGLAPKIPWNPEHYFRWRKYWPYSGGIATDLFPHVLCRLLVALGPEFPLRVNANGGIYVHPDREVPDTFHFLADFPSGHTILMVGSTANEQGLPWVIRGHKGTMYIAGDSLTIRPERPYVEEVEEVQEQVPPPGNHLKAHHHDFLENVRRRGQPRGNVDLSYRWMTVIALSVRAYREQRTMLFDPEKEEIIAVPSPPKGRLRLRLRRG